LDDFYSTNDTLAVGVGERLHDRRIYSCPAGDCNCCGADQNYSGTKTFLTIDILKILLLINLPCLHVLTLQ
jgi:hypothetical protein